MKPATSLRSRSCRRSCPANPDRPTTTTSRRWVAASSAARDRMARVAIVFTGGTISMRPDDLAGGNVPALDGAGILALAPDVAGVAEIEIIDWGRVPASHLTFAQMLSI